MEFYDEIIEYANLDIAVCSIIEKKDGIYMPFFENFYLFVKENFLKNYTTFIEFAEKKNADFKNTAVNFKTSFYSINMNADYNKLLVRLKYANDLLTKV
jgi:hypothetical protein